MPQSETWTAAGQYDYALPAHTAFVEWFLRGGRGGDAGGDTADTLGNGGRAGWTEARIDASDLPSDIDVYVAGVGEDAGDDAFNPGHYGEGGFNGGVDGVSAEHEDESRWVHSGGSGGASDIRPDGGALSDRLLVAGGGGAGAAESSRDDDGDATGGADAGFPEGDDADDTSTDSTDAGGGEGGTQDSGGAGGSGGVSGDDGSFGDGGGASAASGSSAAAAPAPGGGGWYGGGGGGRWAGAGTARAAGGGGGSGYVDAVAYSVSTGTTFSSPRVEAHAYRLPIAESVAIDTPDSDTLSITWDLVDGDDVGDVIVEIETDDSGTWDHEATLAAGTESYTKTDAEDGQWYRARVRVEYDDVERTSDPSDAVVTPLPDAAGLELTSTLEDE